MEVTEPETIEREFDSNDIREEEENFYGSPISSGPRREAAQSIEMAGASSGNVDVERVVSDYTW